MDLRSATRCGGRPLGVVAGLVLLIRGSGLPHPDPGRHLDLADRRDRGRRGPGERRHRAGRDHPRSRSSRAPCVYYRSTIGDAGERRPRNAATRGAGDRLPGPRRDRDIRVFPRGARFDAPVRFEGETGTVGDEPAGLDIRRGGPTRIAEVDRAAAAAELLRVRAPIRWSPAGRGAATRTAVGRYREARLEPGDAVTIVGPRCPSPTWPIRPAPTSPTDRRPPRRPGGRRRPRRGAGGRACSPTTRARPGATRRSRASGSAGRSRARPRPGGAPAAAGRPDEAARAERTFDDRPGDAGPRGLREVPLLIASASRARSSRGARTQFLVGLLGAILAIASAMVARGQLSGGFGR